MTGVFFQSVSSAYLRCTKYSISRSFSHKLLTLIKDVFLTCFSLLSLSPQCMVQFAQREYRESISQAYSFLVHRYKEINIETFYM